MMHEMSRADFFALPDRPWNEVSDHTSLIVFPSGTKHDSGYGNITVIGCTNKKPTLILTRNTDDLTIEGDYRIDCFYKSKALHFWTRGLVFMVFESLSSMKVVIKKEPGRQT